MSHDQLREKLWALYDGELSIPERRELEHHLEDCEECLQALSQWQKTSAALFPKAEPFKLSGEVFTQRVMAQVRPLPHPNKLSFWRSFLPWLSPVMGSAAVAGWVLFFVLPATPGLSLGPNASSFFSEDTPEATSVSWTSLPATSKGEEWVTRLVKE